MHYTVTTNVSRTCTMESYSFLNVSLNKVSPASPKPTANKTRVS